MDCRNRLPAAPQLAAYWAGSPTQDRGDYTERRDNGNQARFPSSAVTVTAEYPVCFELSGGKGETSPDAPAAFPGTRRHGHAPPSELNVGAAEAAELLLICADRLCAIEQSGLALP